jgi:hypothetical protein
MRKIAMSLALTLAPAALLAQVQARAQSQTSADAAVNAGPQTTASTSTSASVDAEIAVARKRGLPERPFRRRAAEGRAKGASEAQIALAMRSLRANLETAHEAMVRAGRTRPSDEETECGGYALERGYTSAQLEAVVRSAPSDRSLVVAFDVLASLQSRGVVSANAVARVSSMLAGRASDADISGLVRANSGATAAGAAHGTAGIGGSAAAGATKGGVSAGGAVTGTVKGVIKP